MRTDGGDEARLTTDVSDEFDPAWSPDGKKIVFVSDRNAGRYDLYVMGAKGGGLRRLTATSEMEFEPAWSPDGTRSHLRGIGRRITPRRASLS